VEAHLFAYQVQGSIPSAATTTTTKSALCQGIAEGGSYLQHQIQQKGEL
jgi:hypothetical protein